MTEHRGSTKKMRHVAMRELRLFTAADRAFEGFAFGVTHFGLDKAIEAALDPRLDIEDNMTCFFALVSGKSYSEACATFGLNSNGNEVKFMGFQFVALDPGLCEGNDITEYYAENRALTAAFREIGRAMRALRDEHPPNASDNPTRFSLLTLCCAM